MKLIVKEEKNILDYLEEHTDYSKKKLKSLLKYHNISLNQKKIANFDILSLCTRL